MLSHLLIILVGKFGCILLEKKYIHRVQRVEDCTRKKNWKIY